MLIKYKRHKFRTTANIIVSAIAVLALLLMWSFAAHSATNEVIDPGGGGVTLIPSGQVTVTSVQLGLMIQARDITGTVIPDGADITPGQEIYFVLYVDNSTAALASDIRISDIINESEFTYVPDSIETAVVPTGSDDAAIWAGLWTSRTDNVGGRITAGLETAQVNQPLDIPGNSIWAIRFRVTVN